MSKVYTSADQLIGKTPLLELTPTNERRLYVRKGRTRKPSSCIFSHRVKVASRHRYISVPCH